MRAAGALVVAVAIVTVGTVGFAAADASPAPLPTDARSRLARRLTAELHDRRAVEQAVAGVDQGIIDRLVDVTGDDLENSPVLSYTPARVRAGKVDSLWLFSWGYRIKPAAGIAPVSLSDTPPPMEVLTPGPVNATIARTAAAFVAHHPMPIIAQWEIARELERLGVKGVISVEPRRNPDGTTSYLSTPEVVTEGLRLASDAHVTVGHAGVITFDKLAVGTLLVARSLGLDAAVPTGVRLPTKFDPKSGQLWTRSLSAWVPVDLLGRSIYGK